MYEMTTILAAQSNPTAAVQRNEYSGKEQSSPALSRETASREPLANQMRFAAASDVRQWVICLSKQLSGATVRNPLAKGNPDRLMRVLRAKPSNIAKRCQRLRAGDLLILERGTYDRPVIVTGIAGTPQKPIVIEAENGAVVTSRLTLKKYTARANHIALRRQAAGNYPSVGQTADEAALAFIHCKHVIVEGLQFRRCWPTAVYLDECQHIRLDGLKIREGTIAIGANGMTTRDVTVCHCDWRQDLSDEHRMWNTVPWRASHGSRNNSGTGVDPD